MSAWQFCTLHGEVKEVLSPVRDLKGVIKDGCTLECPAHIIEMTESGPVRSDGAEEICIQCGHCVAVCPRAAVTLNFLSPEECMPVKKELALDAAHTGHCLLCAHRQQPPGCSMAGD